MPRKAIQIEQRVEWLSVLSPDGQVDASLEPKIPDADLRRLYKCMLLTRLFDERCLHLQRQGRIGTYGPCRGQEATPLAAVYHLNKDDWFVPTYRELPGYLWRGWPLDKYLCWWGGHEYGSAVPPDINDLPICVPIASQCQYAMGIAWGLKMRRAKSVCVAFCGDGGTSQGDFHEALNYATVFKVPLVMVVQNNHWAISLPRERQTASPTIAQKALAYGLDGVQIDGNDILAGLVAIGEAVDKARTGGGPSLIEAVTYRMAMHTTADDPKKYRSEDEVRQWEERDPLRRFAAYLRGRKLLDDKIQALLEDEIRKEIDQGVERYELYRHDPFDMFRFMYADPTPELKAQEEELRAYLNGQAPHAAPPKDLSRV